MTRDGLTALKRHEGFRSRPYKDTVGKQTIGYGRNLDDNPITPTEAEFLMNKPLYEAETAARVLCPTFDTLAPARQDVLINMAYNMGQMRLSGFKLMFKAIEREDWPEAAFQMLDSQWSNQVGYRAKELATLMSLGVYA